MAKRRGRGYIADEVVSATSKFYSPSLTDRLLHDVVEPLREVEDRRTYHPLEDFRPARNVLGALAGPVRVTPKNKSKPFLAHGLSFSAPKTVALCVRRKRRKEVLFAKNKTRAGAKSRRRRRNWFSAIGC